MVYIKRAIEKGFEKYLKPNKVLILLGARRVGKTELLKHYLQKIKEPYLLLNGEDTRTASVLGNRSVENYKRLLGNNKLLVIDEAQAVPEIGKILKLIVDEIEGIKVAVTGIATLSLKVSTACSKL